jgi:hypothetical protein
LFILETTSWENENREPVGRIDKERKFPEEIHMVELISKLNSDASEEKRCRRNLFFGEGELSWLDK